MRLPIQILIRHYAFYLIIAALLFNLDGIEHSSFAGSAATPGPIRIVALGDSLTAGYGLPPKAAFPAQLAQVLKRRGHNVELSNAGVSGDTTAAGLRRLDWSVPEGTDAVIVELGANDALRAMPPQNARANLDEILTRLRERKLDVLLTGMTAPRSLGPAYAEEFDRIFAELAKKHGTLLYPFFLEGVATNPALNLDDGLHPNSKGVAVIVEQILPKVEELIAAVKARRAGAITAN
jgi:acyl-CoA thioesterase-1